MLTDTNCFYAGGRTGWLPKRFLPKWEALLKASYSDVRRRVKRRRRQKA